MYEKSLFIFRRDLRLDDNTGLIAACEQSKDVIPCFILDPAQTEEHEYRSLPALAFMLESLRDLNEQLKEVDSQLYLFQGSSPAVVAKLLKQEKISAVFFNADFTPFSKRRDASINKICKEAKATCHRFNDSFLHSPGSVLKADELPYTVYTPFMRKARQLNVQKPQKLKNPTLHKNSISSQIKVSSLNPQEYQVADPLVFGGSTAALSLLKRAKGLSNYKEERDIPSLSSTSHLSAHNKFGTVSIRKVYQSIVAAHSAEHTLVNELYWRDFFSHIGYHFPHVYQGSFRKKYNSIKWSKSRKNFDRWCQGQTGFPIVDAGMRELNQTGYMHNRVRMITASFLVKDLHLSWRWGERYFAQRLVDYDPAVNNGNWQWAASTGCDAQPYFRIFNPWLQQKRFDVEAIYIKRWVPELEKVPAKHLHDPKALSASKQGSGYPDPICDHRVAKDIAEDLFRSIAN